MTKCVKVGFFTPAMIPEEARRIAATRVRIASLGLPQRQEWVDRQFLPKGASWPRRVLYGLTRATFRRPVVAYDPATIGYVVRVSNRDERTLVAAMRRDRIRWSLSFWGGQDVRVEKMQ